MNENVQLRETKEVPQRAIVGLYRSVGWSSAEKPDALHKALCNSDTLVTAWDGHRLVGLANAISDGHLVVYYPHAVVHPDYQRKGIGRQIMDRVMKPYQGFHQHSILADKEAVEFYRRCGFVQAGETHPMWIFDGSEH